MRSCWLGAAYSPGSWIRRHKLSVKPLNQLTREELYEAVWSEAMATLAPKLGISDVGLKKRCAKLGVPTPPRGYWAKLEAGKKVTKASLPDSWSIQRKKKRVPKSADEIRKLEHPERDYSVTKYPGAVLVTKRSLKGARPNYYGVVDAWEEGGLRTRVSPALFDRSLWLWTELLERLALNGIAVKTGSTLGNGIESVTIELKEMTAKYETELDKQPPRPRLSLGLPAESKSEHWVPTGILVFRAEDVHRAGCAHQWRETELRRMEDRLDDVATGIDKLLERKHELAIEAAERQKQWQEESRRREEEEAKRRHERARRRKLGRIAAAFHQAQQIRNFVDELERRAGTQSEPSLENFAAWARITADRVDPSAAVLNELADGKDPVTPENEDLYPSDDLRPWSY